MHANEARRAGITQRRAFHGIPLRARFTPRRLAAQFAHQPDLGQTPVAHNRFRGDLQDLGCLLDAQSAEEAQLNHLLFAAVHFGQGAERIINGDKVRGRLRCDRQRLVQRHARLAAARLAARLARARSTRICRMIRAQMPKKCARSCQSTCLMSMRRTYASFTKAVVWRVGLGRSRSR